MVTKASNYGAREAKRIGLVEEVAPTLPVLLDRIDGMKTVPKGYVLHTADAQVTDVEMTFWQRARDFLVDPNLIALMTSPTTRADFRRGRFGCSPASCIAYRTRRCTGFRPSRASGSARETMTLIA